ncbi:MAG: hypothetical protein KDI50_08885 [Candidatus Competibacteraceae bacterium]|nr:hypothetical protein [Candidatus Competibacteraceae bacterium]
MNISTQNAALIPQVETRIDRLTVLQGTVLRCIGALDGNADATSRLVCEALQQVADELAEMVVYDTELYATKLSQHRYQDVVKQPIDLDNGKTDG